jgi:hypothetical protein
MQYNIAPKPACGTYRFHNGIMESNIISDDWKRQPKFSAFRHHT